MKENANFLAIVPARSGSKGIPNKNMQRVSGVSLIGRAGSCLAQLPWIDDRIISTDSEEYAEEGRSFDLQCLGLRPSGLSGDSANVIDVMEYEMRRAEERFGKRYSVVILVEPSSPLRTAQDIEDTVDRMLAHDSGSAITISPASSKHHPVKALCVEGNVVRRYMDTPGVVSRQDLNTTYVQNGFCYAITRDSLLNDRSMFLATTTYQISERPYANIDDPIDLLWARFLFEMKERQSAGE